MKKISILLLLSINAFFLTGCLHWQKKQNTDNIENSPIKIENNDNTEENSNTQITEITFDENNPDYIITSGKTIFDDSNTEDEIVDQKISTEENKISDNCLNNFLLQEEPSTASQENVITIEKNKSHLSTLLFAFDKYEEIKSEYEQEMQSAINQIQREIDKNQNTTVIIEGHACNSCGSERYNLELSNNRAITIKNKILKNTSISPEKLSVFGCGTSHLIMHGGRVEQGPNRRVEIFIVNN